MISVTGAKDIVALKFEDVVMRKAEESGARSLCLHQGVAKYDVPCSAVLF